jgi:hypothetical protein
LDFFKVLATVYHLTEKERSNIPGEERALLLVLNKYMFFAL